MTDDWTETDDPLTLDLTATSEVIAAATARARTRAFGPYNWATEPDQEWT